jgi:hypothetical protein
MLFVTHSEQISDNLKEEHEIFFTLCIGSVVPSSQILVTLMKKALSSPETSVLARATWRNVPEDTIIRKSVHLKKSNNQIWPAAKF